VLGLADHMDNSAFAARPFIPRNEEAHVVPRERWHKWRDAAIEPWLLIGPRMLQLVRQKQVDSVSRCQAAAE
jgi:hypothetical protein